MPPTVHGPTAFDLMLEAASARPEHVPTDFGTFALLVAQASGVLVTPAHRAPPHDERLGPLLDLFR